MHIIVTGSAGFIGFHVARRLLADGHTVAGIDSLVPYYDVRLKEQRHALLAQEAGFRAHVSDLADMAATRRILEAERPDVIVHLAAQAGVRYALEHADSYVASNVVGTFNLLELCRTFPVQHFLLASTSSVYGANTTMPFPEDGDTGTPLTIYAASKRATELIGHSYAHLWNQPITAFRFFSVYGPWGRPDMAPFKFTDAALRGKPIDVFNHGEMARDFTYIDDLVEGVVRLIAAVPKRGEPVSDLDSLSPVAPFRIVNIGNGAPVPLLDFIAEIERCVGRPIQRNMLPMQPGELPKNWADTRLLEALTDFRPRTPVGDGVASFVAWFRDYYGL